MNNFDAPGQVALTDPEEFPIRQLESATSPYDSLEPIGQTLAWAASELRPISPDVGDEHLLRVVRAIKEKLAGDEGGLELVSRWCSKGSNGRSRAEIENLWHSIKPSSNKNDGTALADTCIAAVAPIQDSTNAIAPGVPRQASIARTAKNALDQYTINGQLEEIERRAIEQKPILGTLALKGQATMLYAAPNTGKTLITLALAIDGIKAGLIDPSHLYYVNNDDSSTGVAEKLRIAEEYGFQMLAEAHRDFDAQQLLGILDHMIEHDEARNVVVILDTATKVVNVLDAAKTRAFTRVIRRFVLMGGTIIALAHANKNLGADGKPVYRGTTDIVNDFDCIYVLSHLKAGTNEKVIEFENKKRRGDVPLTTAFRYSSEAGISYHELLASVVEVDVSKLDEFKQIETLRTDAELVTVVQMYIANGITSKMRLADAVAECAGVSKRIAIKIIERYTGNDPRLHRWQFSVQERGAKVYSLLGASPPPTASEDSTE